MPNNDLATGIAISLLLNLAIYGGVVLLLFRPALSQRLLSRDAPDAQTRASPQPQLLKLLNSLAERVTFLFVVVLVLVLVFGAPFGMIYFYSVAVPVMLLVLFWLKRRS